MKPKNSQRQRDVGLRRQRPTRVRARFDLLHERIGTAIDERGDVLGLRDLQISMAFVLTISNSRTAEGPAVDESAKGH